MKETKKCKNYCLKYFLSLMIITSVLVLILVMYFLPESRYVTFSGNTKITYKKGIILSDFTNRNGDVCSTECCYFDNQSDAVLIIKAHTYSSHPGSTKEAEILLYPGEIKSLPHDIDYYFEVPPHSIMTKDGYVKVCYTVFKLDDELDD